MSFSCTFLLVYSGLPDSGLEKSGSSAKDLDHLHTRGFASGGIQEEKKRELRKIKTVETMVPHFARLVP
jgi:hypothetical protein